MGANPFLCKRKRKIKVKERKEAIRQERKKKKTYKTDKELKEDQSEKIANVKERSVEAFHILQCRPVA